MEIHCQGDQNDQKKTGDVATGQKVLAAAAGNVKRTHLELGGKAPVIVFEARAAWK